MAAGDFIGAFLNAFAQTQLLGRKAQQEKKLTDAQVKLADAKLRAADTAEERDKLIQQLLTGGVVQQSQPQPTTAPAQSILDTLTQASMRDFLPEQKPIQVPSSALTRAPTAQETLPANPQAALSQGGAFRPPRVEIGPQGTKLVLQPTTAQDRLQEFQLKEEKAKFSQEQADRRRARNKLRTSIMNTLPDIKALAKANEILRGSFLQTGMPLTDLRKTLAGPLSAAKRAFGDNVGADELDRARTALGIFEKKAAKFATAMLNTLTNVGRLTNQKANLIRQQLADPRATPDANAFIMADLLDQAIQAIHDEELQVPQGTLDEMVKLRDGLRNVVVKALNQPGSLESQSVEQILPQDMSTESLKRELGIE